MKKLVMAAYKSAKTKEFVIKSSWASAQKSELCAILMVLSHFPESLNIVTEDQYAERLVLHTAEFILDNSEFTLFLPLHQAIRNSDCP